MRLKTISDPVDPSGKVPEYRAETRVDKAIRKALESRLGVGTVRAAAEFVSDSSPLGLLLDQTTPNHPPPGWKYSDYRLLAFCPYCYAGGSSISAVNIGCYTQEELLLLPSM